MERTQLFRHFRLSAVVLCIIACVLLIVLWIRSYFYLDAVRAALAVHVSSYNGRLLFTETPWSGTIGPSWQSASLSQLDQQVDQALKNDVQMRVMQAQLMVLQAEQAQIRSRSRDGASGRMSIVQRQIEELNRSIDQYRVQQKQMVLRDGRTSVGWFLQLPMASDDLQQPASRFGFSYRSFAKGVALEIPHWFVVLLTAALAAILGVRKSWRFSLRTLLIVVTITAVVLGTITIANS